jgi:mannose-1-phosphate guanylyltransferase/mannose-6-phosphate isomerase
MKTLILAGGIGTRLFPLSRELYPKQFIPLFDDETLFQKTVKRALLFSQPEEITIVTGQNHVFLVRDQLNGICSGCLTLPEPQGKNTLPAIFYGISRIREQDGSVTVAVLPSDHLVPVTEGYRKAMESAQSLSSQYLVTFGIPPDRPHTGYGYIKPGTPLNGGFTVERFVEKPDQNTAEEYIRQGFLWNSGMFMFSTDLFLREVHAYAPEVGSAFQQPLQEAYARTPSISIDYGLMEKTSRAGVVVLDAPWSDVGSFDALYWALPKDAQGNAVRGETIAVDSRRNLVLGERLITTIGVSDLTIVDTKDVLLVGDRTRAQEIRKIVDRLKRMGDERVVLHTTVHRPWGSYTLLEKGQFYTIKRITVLPQRQISLQLHHHRSEHWVVIQGTAEVELRGEKRLLPKGESTFVPAGIRHRLKNPGLLPLELIEVQLGEYIGEDDIVRFDDDFGRT